MVIFHSYVSLPEGTSTYHPFIAILGMVLGGDVGQLQPSLPKLAKEGLSNQSYVPTDKGGIIPTTGVI
jgi:hypothetical protein